MKRRGESIGVEFMDAIFGLAAIAFVLIVLLSILVKMEGNPAVEREGKYVIVATWTSGVDSDVDLWARAPDGSISGFLSRDRGGLSLLRDDLGSSNDRVADDKGKVTLNPLNREEITVRSTAKGEYIVNLHYFRDGGDKPAEGVKAQIELRTSKENTLIVSRELVLKSQGEELTAFTFTLDDRGIVSETSTPEKPILWVVNRGNNPQFYGGGGNGRNGP